MADRELLYGVLAWQVGFVSCADLRAAVQAWRSHPGRPLGQLLVDEQRLTEPRRALVDRLLDEHLLRHPDGVALGADLPPEAIRLLGELRELVATEQHTASQHTVIQRTLPQHSEPQRTLPQRSATIAGDSTNVSPPNRAAMLADRPSPPPDTRFRILRSHARGGLGEVFVAHDEELNREVALKRIRNQYLDTPENRARFLLEAEVTGGLEHPGIVPVYSLGVSEDGQPYYAMRLIRGRSLKGAIDDFHHLHATSDESARLLELRQLLARFIEVCNAVGYAHSRGVLHRDLKPENIMLGNYGETLVVDWGLAKPLGAGGAADAGSPPVEPIHQPPAASDSADAAPIAVTTGGNGRAAPAPLDEAPPAAADSLWRPSASTAPTQMGSALGTPAYMSPEQASGKLDEIGPASDVYSLGATLYCLLVGRAPFSGDALPQMLERVRRGEFSPPRSISRNVPAALEAVCLKAMALEHAVRYASAGDLARDVERWLADEPVSAHEAGWHERLARWGRRHRRAVQIAAAALVIITAVSIGAAVVVHAAKQQVEREHGTTRLALSAEQAAKNEARRAIDSFVNAVTEGDPPRDAQGRALRKRLLAEALKYYEELIDKHGGNEDLRHDLAGAILRVARINRQTGAQTEAIEAFRQALALYKELAERHPLESHYQSEVAASHLGLAEQLRDMGRPKEALAEFHSAVETLEKLVRRDAADHQFHRQLATAYERLAAQEADLHDAASRKHAARASEVRQRLTELERAEHRTDTNRPDQ